MQGIPSSPLSTREGPYSPNRMAFRCRPLLCLLRNLDVVAISRYVLKLRVSFFYAAKSSKREMISVTLTQVGVDFVYLNRNPLLFVSIQKSSFFQGDGVDSRVASSFLFQ